MKKGPPQDILTLELKIDLQSCQEGSCIYVVYLVFEKRSILAAKMAHPKG